MDEGNSNKNNIRVNDTDQSTAPLKHEGDFDLRQRNDIYDNDLLDKSVNNEGLNIARQVKQDIMQTSTEKVVNTDFRNMSLINETNRPDSCVAGLARNSEGKAEVNKEITYSYMEADNNNNAGITSENNNDRETTEYPNLSEQHVIHKLNDASVVEQFNVLAYLRDITQSNLSRLDRVNKGDPAVKRVMAQRRVTAKEVKEVSIDADIDTAVNEFLQTNMVGNFVMVRVLQENYCKFYSWLTAHLQIERNAWVVRLKQALQKLEKERKDCLLMKNTLVTSTSRLQHLIRLCTSVTTGVSDKDIKKEKSSLSCTSFSTIIKDFSFDSLGCSQGAHQQITATSISNNDRAHQRGPKNVMNDMNRLDKRSSDTGRSSNVSSDPSDLASTSTSLSNSISVPYGNNMQNDLYTQYHDQEASTSTAHSMSCCNTPQSPAETNIKREFESTNCENTERKLDCSGKSDTNIKEDDGDKWSQSMHESVNILYELCDELVKDRLACLRLLGVCHNRRSSGLMDMHDIRRVSEQIKIKEVEKRCDSLEIENRQLVKEVNTLYNSLMQKTKEALNLHALVEKLEEELRNETKRIVVNECLETSCLVVNDQEINGHKSNSYETNRLGKNVYPKHRNMVNSYQINRCQEKYYETNKRFKNCTNNQVGPKECLSVIANKSKVSGTGYAKAKQTKDSELNTPHSNTIILRDFGKSHQAVHNERDLTFTTLETPSWSSMRRTKTMITKQRQNRLKFRASESSFRADMEVAGTEITAIKDFQSKPLDIRLETSSQSSINKVKPLKDKDSSHQRRWQYFSNSDQDYSNFNNSSRKWNAGKTSHEELLIQTNQPDIDRSHCSCWHQLNHRSTSLIRDISPTSIPNPCNSPESIERATLTQRTPPSNLGQAISKSQGVNLKKSQVKCADIPTGINHNEMKKCLSQDCINSAIVTKLISQSCHGRQFKKGNGTSTKNNVKYKGLAISLYPDYEGNVIES